MFFYNCGIVGRNEEFCPQDTNKGTDSERHNIWGDGQKLQTMVGKLNTQYKTLC